MLRPMYLLDKSRGPEGAGLGLFLATTIAELRGPELVLSENAASDAPGLFVCDIPCEKFPRLQICKSGAMPVTGSGPISFPEDENWKGQVMKSIRNFFAVAFGIAGALLLAPFITLFGLLMLGFAFGLSLIAAGVLTTWFGTHETDETIDGEAEPVREADAAERRAT